MPANGSAFQAMNFSTFRLAMTQPVHPEWEQLGGSIELLDQNGEAVPATVLVKGNRITVDPCVAERCGSKEDILAAGETYTLKLSNLASLTNSAEDNRFSAEYNYTPRDTGPTVMLEQQAVDSNGGAIKSVLNDEAVNGVVLNSVLQGVTDSSQQTGSLFAELAYSPSFEANEALPLRIPKGSVLESTSLNVKVGGKVQVLDAATGGKQQTGTIKVTMLSDASGYMSPNPYTDDLNAPRHITLFMDVSMNTEEAQPNAALSQDLMGVELRGIALVQNGVLTIDAIGMVEPNLLGQEFTDSTIAFQLKAATDVNSALDAEDDWLRDLDTTPPQLVSWMPGAEDAIPATRQSMQRPGDPVILLFDEPLDPASIKDNVSLTATSADTSAAVDFAFDLDGTALALNPAGGLKHGTTYDISVNGVTDLAGNPVSLTRSFVMEDLGENSENFNSRSPIALTTYPGFPCVTTGVDLTANPPTHGQCLDSAPDGPLGQQLPLTTLPEDRPIVVVFSQSMNLDSINDQTFIVEKVTGSDTPVGEGEIVAGRLEKNNQRIRFYPDQPWSKEEGVFYRYTMKSQQDGSCSDGVICAEGDNGLALQTDLLVDPEDVGGPDMAIYFRGTDAVSTVFTPLRNLPVRDTNSNYEIDCDDPEGLSCLEPFNHGAPDENGEYMPSANAAKLALRDDARLLGGDSGIIPARIGCDANGDDCPMNKFIYQTYGLNTEVIGPAIDEETGQEGIRVLLYPTMLATTSASVYLTPLGEQATGPQILRMTYAAPEDRADDNPLGLVEGMIIEGENGQPTFKTEAALTLDAPNLHLPIEGLLQHNLYSYPFTLDLEGDIVFFDDGRMQIEQRNVAPRIPADITVSVTVDAPVISDFLNFLKDPEESLREFACALDFLNVLDFCDSTTESVPAGDIEIPLFIPENGVYLNFISNPVKDLPAQYEQQTAQ
ncbi:Ig-like domain-containing protein [Marinobacter sp. G11]|uniref:Ig-like domain-containing protein n=1 Tax=Marinobacter sp. G11 TaxID=2903522 RepID=UPI001E3302E2|nr:Ig-like domain-containing protein [Marinobacter sp. G11]